MLRKTGQINKKPACLRALVLEGIKLKTEKVA